MKNIFDFLIIGGGIFGITTAVELAKRKHRVGLINPDSIPHHLAASTDISKVVRMEYGTDTEYFQMAETSIERWHAWNTFFGEKLYHEVGYVLLCKHALEHESQIYERNSLETLEEFGYQIDRLSKNSIQKRFPAINSEVYPDGNFNPKGGYVESGLVVEKLTHYARTLGVDIHENQTAKEFVIEKGVLQAVKTKEGEVFKCGNAIVAAGANTPYLVPELKPYMKATGHPVFWLKPHDPTLFCTPNFVVFTADISNSGWYGFPFSPKHGVVKIAKHTIGLELNPDDDDRLITSSDISDMRTFLSSAFPALANAPLVYTRRCLYTDTLDGHFWIDQHPEIKGLSVSSGGSGHGFKMGPVIGEMTADMAEGKEHVFSKRYRWRHLDIETKQCEEARHLGASF